MASPERLARNRRRVKAGNKARAERLRRREEAGEPLANPPIWVRGWQRYVREVMTPEERIAMAQATRSRMSPALRASLRAEDPERWDAIERGELPPS